MNDNFFRMRPRVPRPGPGSLESLRGFATPLPRVWRASPFRSSAARTVLVCLGLRGHQDQTPVCANAEIY